MSSKPVEQLDRVIIRFAGDSGDGMQLTGDRFTSETALMGNDLATLPDFPAEIRAPAGSLPGVSGFQVHFADHDILTPGDQPNVLVAMNPAALKTNLEDLPKGGTLIINTDAFNDRNLQKAGYASSPLTDGSLEGFHLHEVALTSMTVEALKGVAEITSREAERSKNFFALGLMSWLYNRATEGTLAFIEEKFGKRPSIADANIRAFKAGYNYGETSEDFAVSYEIAPARLAPGRYRQITGNTAISYGLIAACRSSPACRSSWVPIRSLRHRQSSKSWRGTRASASRPSRRRTRSQPAARLSAPSFGGALGVTTSAGPGIVLKAETIGLGVMLELPLLVLDIQRAGPSTGMPTKPEQADLLMVLFGRNGESPVPVVAASSPSQCFHAAIEAARIALKYRTPVYLLSDAYLANGSEPWLIPDVTGLPSIATSFATGPNYGDVFHPYERDPETFARPWAVPGTPGLEHRIGGLEKADVTGSISYDPDNHDRMIRLRAQKVANIAADIRGPSKWTIPEAMRGRSFSAGARPSARSGRPCGGCGGKAARSRAHTSTI